MKNPKLLCLILLVIISKVYGQEANYNLIKYKKSEYGSWNDYFPNDHDFDSFRFNTHGFSRSSYKSFDLKDGSSLFIKDYTCVFINNEPSQEYPFRKQIKCNYSNRILETGKPDYEKKFSYEGYIYSTTPYDKILKGEIEVDIFLDYGLNNGIEGFKISIFNIDDFKSFRMQEFREEMSKVKTKPGKRIFGTVLTMVPGVVAIWYFAFKGAQ